MSLKIIKRNGEEVGFNLDKIFSAIKRANEEVSPVLRLSDKQIKSISESVEKSIEDTGLRSVENIQDFVEKEIMKAGKFDVAKKYMIYRYQHELMRKSNTTDAQVMSLLGRKNEDLIEENANKNPIIVSTQRDYMAGLMSDDICERFIFDHDLMEAHKAGLIHIHDLDYAAQKGITNCCLINLKDMLQNGTVISGTGIDKPKSFSTACNVATQIIAQVASNQFGGQTINLAHLAPFVDVSRKKLYKIVQEEGEKAGVIYSLSQIDAIVESRLKEEIARGVQMLQYQVITLMTTNGQAPFISVFMYLGDAENKQEEKDLAMVVEEVLKQRMLGVKNEKGFYITPAFPKLLYVLDENNINEDSEYYYLTELAAKCTAKRMVPDYISAKVMREMKEGNVYGCMGCRSFLAPWKDENGNYKFWGRFNTGVVTVNLVDIACSSKKDMDEFWKIFDERLKLCRRALQIRHNRLYGVPSDVAPILWQNGAYARLKKGETIDKLIEGGYSSLSLGYAGLYECVKYMTGKSHTDPSATPFAVEVMKRLKEATEKWNAEENFGYSLYGTPIESTTYKFAKCLKKRFGVIEGVTDKNYITNSYHVNVTEKINAFDKLTFESKLQKYSTGGAVSYVEVPNMQNNIPAVLAVIKHIYNTILYAELNTKSDFCQVCNYEGEIKIIEDGNKLIWECPNCGNRDQTKMNVARRTCGYVGTNFFNQGRTQEIKERALHL